ncbi:MAG: hypothetical protein E6G41_07245 [Actinobacteria bacterium]|nr:MAG: hypothetical protein E6G41_07245 [Actinomycetota bacterium]
MSKSTRTLASVAATLALAAPPAALARPAVEAPNHHNSSAYFEEPAVPAQPSSDGFDWGSAAIGAGGVAGLIVLFSAGAAATRRVRVLPTR